MTSVKPREHYFEAPELEDLSKTFPPTKNEPDFIKGMCYLNF